MNSIENLKVSLEESGEILRKLSFQIPRQEYDRRFDAALSQATGKVSLKGFRPGRVPKAMIAKLYGESIHGEVMESLAINALDSAIRDHKLKVVGQPEVNFDNLVDGGDVTFNAAVTVLPEPIIGNARGLALEVEVAAVKEEEIDGELEQLRISKAEFAPLTGRETAANGDFVRIDYHASVDGEGFPGSHRHDVLVELGQKRLADGIEAALVGAKVGENKTAEVPFSADHKDPKLAGKTAIYDIAVKSIETRTLPELTDELISNTDLGKTVAEARETIRKQLDERVTEGNNQRKERALFERLLADNQFELPQTLIDEEIRSMLFNMGALNRRDKRSYQVDVSGFRDPLGKEAEFRVRSLIVLDRIVESSNFEINDDELEVWLDELVKDSGFKSRDELNRNFGYPESKERLRQVLARERMTKDLIASASFSERPLVETPEEA